jgi:hypothetical protein
MKVLRALVKLNAYCLMDSACQRFLIQGVGFEGSVWMLNQVSCLGVVLWCWRCVENALILQTDIYRFLVRSLVDNESNLTRGFSHGFVALSLRYLRMDCF